MRLLDIIDQHNQLLKTIIEAEGEVLDDVLCSLKANSEELSTKVDSIVAVNSRLKSEIDLWRAERDELDSRIKTLVKTQQRLNACVKEAMLLSSHKSLEGNKYQFNLSNMGHTYEWHDHVTEKEREDFLKQNANLRFVDIKYQLRKTELKEFIDNQLIEGSVDHLFKRVKIDRLSKSLKTSKDKEWNQKTLKAKS